MRKISEQATNCMLIISTPAHNCSKTSSRRACGTVWSNRVVTQKPPSISFQEMLLMGVSIGFGTMSCSMLNGRTPEKSSCAPLQELFRFLQKKNSKLF